jgi:4-hydroxyphenylpyruvate dioxygenase-like putative hemolysin
MIKIVSSILLVLGLFLQGALAYKESTALAVAELEAKLAKAEAKSAQTNTVIVEKIVKDTEVIRTKGKTITEYVDREVVKYNNICLLPSEVIRAHNAAATMDPSKIEGDQK